MKRIIENRQSRSRPRLGIDSKQYLVGNLIPRRCRRLSEGNVKNVPIRIVSDTGRSHRSPLLSRNLIRCHDEIVFGSVGSETEPNHRDDRGIVGGQVFEISIIKEYIGTERILKPSPSLNRLQNFAFISLHFRMFFANMRPTLIGQINLVSQRIRYRAKHLGQLIHAVCRESHCDASMNGKALYVAAFNKSWAKPLSSNRSIIGCRSFPSQGIWAMANQSQE